MSGNPNAGLPPRAQVQFDCHGQATGKMRNDLTVHMVQPFREGPFELATDEGSFHGGDATAPPPLALFIAGLTGCIMTQIRAFAKRLGVTLDDLSVDARAVWDWQARDRIYETAPNRFEIDIAITSPDQEADVIALIDAARRGCFLEQTLGVANDVTHRLRTPDGWKAI